MNKPTNVQAMTYWQYKLHSSQIFVSYNIIQHQTCVDSKYKFKKISIVIAKEQRAHKVTKIATYVCSTCKVLTQIRVDSKDNSLDQKIRKMYF